MPSTGRESVLHRFTCQGDGGYPYSGLVLSGNTLYGTTVTGGSGSCQRGCGVVFALNINERIITGLHKFLGPDGAVPYAGLVQDKSGKLTALLASEARTTREPCSRWFPRP